VADVLQIHGRQRDHGARRRRVQQRGERPGAQRRQPQCGAWQQRPVGAPLNRDDRRAQHPRKQQTQPPEQPSPGLDDQAGPYDQTDHRRGQGHGPAEIQARWPSGPTAVWWNRAENCDADHCGQGYVPQQHPPPAGQLRHRSAHYEAARTRRGTGRAPRGDRPVARGPSSCHRRQQPQRGRNRHSRRGALGRAGSCQHRHRNFFLTAVTARPFGTPSAGAVVDGGPMQR